MCARPEGCPPGRSSRTRKEASFTAGGVPQSTVSAVCWGALGVVLIRKEWGSLPRIISDCQSCGTQECNSCHHSKVTKGRPFAATRTRAPSVPKAPFQETLALWSPVEGECDASTSLLRSLERSAV